MIQANCSISGTQVGLTGTPISFSEVPNVEVVQTPDGNFRIVNPVNGQHYGIQEQQIVHQ